ncbi:hypothetical protein ABFS83_11G123200 [Erythranthe nasuta]
MASATGLHYTAALSRTILPLLHHRGTFLHPHFRRHSNSAGLFASFSRRCKREFQPVFAQARRSFSSAVASPSDLQFEGPLKIIEYPDPKLRAKNKRVDTFDESLKKLVDEMFDVMYKDDGVGLSAPQVGMNVQVMVFNPAGERGEGEEIVLVNPRINRYSRQIVPFDEGCLSFPGVYADVERPNSLVVEAQDINGAKFEVNLTGFPARIFQHEFDHLQGILFFDKMSDEILDTIRAELQALEKKYEERTGLPSPERIDIRRKIKKAVGFGKS